MDFACKQHTFLERIFHVRFEMPRTSLSIQNGYSFDNGTEIFKHL